MLDYLEAFFPNYEYFQVQYADVLREADCVARALKHEEETED